MALLIGAGIFLACSTANSNPNAEAVAAAAKPTTEELQSLSKAYFASGCFWCVEAIFESVEGVSEAVSGYSGGTTKNPTYQAVSSGQLKHAEAVEVYYDPQVVSYETLVKVFFGSHDPTTLNRQGPDRGPQYRSALFYQNDSERQIAEAYLKELTDSQAYSSPIVTEVVPFDIFYPAEDYHQDYERRNPDNRYVRGVSIPRLNRFKAKFPDLLKTEGGH